MCDIQRYWLPVALAAHIAWDSQNNFNTWCAPLSRLVVPSTVFVVLKTVCIVVIRYSHQVPALSDFVNVLNVLRLMTLYMC